MNIDVSTGDGSAQLLYILVVAPAVFLFVAIRAAVWRYRIARRVRSQTVISEYAPPRGMTPAELGVLYDGRAGYREVYATYLDLERRGIIKEVSRTDIQAYGLVEGADLSQLKRHETVVIDMIEAGVFTLPGRNNIADSQLFAREVDAAVAERLQLEMRSFTSHALSVVRLAGLLAAWMIVAFVVYAIPWSDSPTTQQILEALPFILFVGLLVVIMCSVWVLITAVAMHIVFGMLFGRVWAFGHKARALWVETEGYRQYLKQAELGRLKFESDDVTVRAKKDGYAYAVALGLDVPVDAKL